MVNPFEIKTPEQNSAKDIVELFVDVFPDFGQILEKGHTFLNGPRGSGKSMMFRYMQPDCQMLVKGCEAKDLEYFSVYVGIKQTSINNSDLARLDSHASILFNEHLLSTFVVSNILNSIRETFGGKLNYFSSELYSFYKDTFVKYVGYSSFQIEREITSDIKGTDILLHMITVVEDMERVCLSYCKRIALANDVNIPYEGPLTDFVDFVEPIILGLKSLSMFPQDKPFYILIDDAGYLNLPQTKVLNTWVSYRSTKNICLKISTQLDYKTHLTSNGKRIDAPHDYSEIDISTRYTSSKSAYNERIREIVKKRIQKYLKVEISPEEFFPENEKQKLEIQKIAEEIKNEKYDPDKPYVAGDAVKRYARPEYIKRMQKEKKAGFHYSYAGFDQLVAISSGIIRHFLAPAQAMFSTALALNKEQPINSITPQIQDEVIKEYSDAFLYNEFDDFRKDKALSEDKLDNSEKLCNLVDALGQLFHIILVSNATDRRVFSVALTDNPDKELYDILDMCEQYGYIHKGSIGNKSGTGRNRLYVLSRILAPHFKLDPTSYAGYKFMKSSVLKIALTDTKRFLRHFEKNLDGGEDTQQDLFGDNFEDYV